jgi:hypothetical protein
VGAGVLGVDGVGAVCVVPPDGAGAFFGFFFLTAFNDGSACVETLAEMAAEGTSITLPTLAAAASGVLPPPPALAPRKATANTATTTPIAIPI